MRHRLLVLMLTIGCVLATAAGAAPPPLKQGGYYSFAHNGLAYADLEEISTSTGEGTDVWSLGLSYVGDFVTWFGWTPFGLAFDEDGTMYVTQNILSFDPSLVRSQLARVDAETGAVTPIGEPVPFNTSGPEIDADGTMYVCGFQVEALGYVWGNSTLWKVDKKTGAFAAVGDTGHTNWMDLAFDSEGVLWGTFDNRLYTIDTATGASTLVGEIHGVPNAGFPDFMEVMSIAFDKHDVLYGTAMTVYYADPSGSPVMRIDTRTGHATLLGYTHQPYNHGGDILLGSGDE
jgi:hypothetical protein